MKKIIVNVLLLVLTVALAVFPLVYTGDADFGGADGKAEEVVAEINPQYRPWFSPVWEPPSGEIESLLFVLQGAAGAGFIGYYFGYLKGKKKPERD